MRRKVMALLVAAALAALGLVAAPTTTGATVGSCTNNNYSVYTTGGPTYAGLYEHNSDATFQDWGDGSGDVHGGVDLYNQHAASVYMWLVDYVHGVLSTKSVPAFTGSLTVSGWPYEPQWILCGGGHPFYVKVQFSDTNGHTAYEWLYSDGHWAQQAN